MILGTAAAHRAEIARLTAALAEARRDTERLGWLLSNGPIDVNGVDGWTSVETREEIDAARIATRDAEEGER